MEELGQSIGRQLKGGEVIELASDLGGGKTTFVRGLARGAGSDDHVSSPTFTISNQYKVNSKTKLNTIYHFDFYRLNEPGLIEHELKEAINNHSAVVIEWPKVIKHVLPKDCLLIKIKHTPKQDRQVAISCPKALNYLIEII